MNLYQNDIEIVTNNEAPWILGSWGEWLFIFSELGSTANYFRGAEEQAHTCTLGDLGNTAKREKNIRLPFYLIL